MSDYKCAASDDGMCCNVIGYGTPCSGYSKQCALRDEYKRLSEMTAEIRKNIKNAYGIHGDNDD